MLFDHLFGEIFQYIHGSFFKTTCRRTALPPPDPPGTLNPGDDWCHAVGYTLKNRKGHPSTMMPAANPDGRGAQIKWSGRTGAGFVQIPTTGTVFPVIQMGQGFLQNQKIWFGSGHGLPLFIRPHPTSAGIRAGIISPGVDTRAQLVTMNLTVFTSTLHKIL